MNQRDKIRYALDRIAQQDAALWKELEGKFGNAELPMAAAAVTLEGFAGPQAQLEAIVLRSGRPVLAVRDNQAVIELEVAEAKIWQERLFKAAPLLHSRIKAIGRVEVSGHRYYDWVGTGWLVMPDIIVTNRHVAQEFTRHSGTVFDFAVGRDGSQMSAHIDYLEEIGSSASRTVRLIRVLHVEDDEGPDLAFFKVARDNAAEPIPLQDKVRALQHVATIGYPARDSRIPDGDLMDRLYGNVYNKKRLAPGQLVDAAGDAMIHDCTTLGGNSGSPVLDLDTGHAVAIHYAGRFLEANYAVPAAFILDRLQRITNGSKPTPPRPLDAPTGLPAPGVGAPVVQHAAAAALANRAITLTIPLQISISLGGSDAPTLAPDTSPSAAAAAPTTPVAAPTVPANVLPTATAAITAPVAPRNLGDQDEPFEKESRIEDYLDRRGYDQAFIDGRIIPLPQVVRDIDELLTFDLNGQTGQTVLPYTHFSVMLHGKRRLCIVSAVNIDGRQSRKTTRSGWRIDPRIARQFQIIRECYGPSPYFSRGHMTRREDPAWGDLDVAEQGNRDSMHVTNAVPQMQPFNGGIWLGLEDYALQNAKRDYMRITVFTGPVLRADDPVHYGVAIPQSFWKVIAFIHDQTGELSATGYMISQRKHMPEEFVYGRFDTHQRSLQSIEAAAGLRFDLLREVDRFGADEMPDRGPLLSPDQIQW